MPDETRAAQVREDDRAFMHRALTLAARGWGQTAPNPMVGAVVVRDGAVVGEGYHARYGESHAEVVALGAAGERARGATLYVTLEPCNHHGHTPPCVDAVLRAGIARVVMAIADPNPVAAGGAARLRGAGVIVDDGVGADAARELNAPFLAAYVRDRPWMVLKLAISLDGAIADAARSRGWLTGAEARREVHCQRAGADAIAVGIGTVLADDPLLTVRDVPPPRVAPVRVIFDREARLPLGSRLMRSVDVARVVAVTDGSAREREIALERTGATVLRARGTAEALRALKSMGIDSLYAEGGAGLAGALLEGGWVDRLIIFRAPVVLGAGALGAFDRAPSFTLEEAPRFRIVRERRFGEDDMTIYALR